ncbi:hypothetical protein BDN72DRAFT_778450 [Pluteus cervinus]|uniref:Uncharacterized protein n=1 Tax=Pluteus cervinus TaxID=181527 RepID=A0ACD3A773_9AGAR|nr:hypothetical protein BDN72DRAFT_778450 [Pluteus cervinus]
MRVRVWVDASTPEDPPAPLPNGVHEVDLAFCQCPGSDERSNQLLQFGWFPATTQQPRTAATLRVLKYFQILSFESKCSAFEFYETLKRMTDNSGTRPLRNRYPAFLRMIREYRNIKMLKRAGRAHDVTGIDGTKLGECAVLCPACPHPGLNLPSDWESQPVDKL